jgi:hypothetical protein
VFGIGVFKYTCVTKGAQGYSVHAIVMNDRSVCTREKRRNRYEKEVYFSHPFCLLSGFMFLRGPKLV